MAKCHLTAQAKLRGQNGLFCLDFSYSRVSKSSKSARGRFDCGIVSIKLLTSVGNFRRFSAEQAVAESTTELLL